MNIKKVFSNQKQVKDTLMLQMMKDLLQIFEEILVKKQTKMAYIPI